MSKNNETTAMKHFMLDTQLGMIDEIRLPRNDSEICLI